MLSDVYVLHMFACVSLFRIGAVVGVLVVM